MSDIVIKNINKAFGPKQVLQNLSITFESGQKTVIMGDSGCGKTTLLRILMGFETPDSGKIEGLEKQKISAVFQEDRLCEDFSAVSNVRLAIKRDVDDDAIAAHLAEVGLSGSLFQPVKELSGGMKRRVAIVRAMLAEKDVLLLDEPLKGLDEHNKEAVALYIKKHSEHVTTIMVTHDSSEVAMMGARLIRMEKVGQDED